MIKKIFLDCFTGKDNRTFDIGRFLWVSAFIAYLVYSGLEIVYGHDFNPKEFAEGISWILGVGSGALLLKKDTEPK